MKGSLKFRQKLLRMITSIRGYRRRQCRVQGDRLITCFTRGQRQALGWATEMRPKMKKDALDLLMQSVMQATAASKIQSGQQWLDKPRQSLKETFTWALAPQHTWLSQLLHWPGDGHHKRLHRGYLQLQCTCISYLSALLNAFVAFFCAWFLISPVPSECLTVRA